MPKTSFYYTLLVRDNKNSPWEIEFGDYVRAVVGSEREDWLDHYDDNDKKRLRKNTLIITSNGTTEDIENIIL